MGKEIERKFLVIDNSWQETAKPQKIQQGYLAKQNGVTARVRTIAKQGFLTIKGPTTGISRAEFEYEIPYVDALGLLELCAGPTIEKYRSLIPCGNHLWEVDEFLGENEGLVVAEIELSAEEESFESPPWLGKEVSSDKRYFNSKLAEFPYRDWVK